VNVIFIEPAFPANQREFVRGLAEAGADVIGIGERPADWLDGDLRGWMIHYQQIPNVTDVGALIEAVRFAQSQVWVDALESTIESHTMAAAHAREACGIPGTSVRTAYLCRDKPAMKEALRAVGISTAQSMGASSAAEVREFVASIGYPIILKPRAAAGASGTSRVDSDTELDRALAELGASGATDIAVEEFVEGHEGFYDTISIDGHPAYDFISHYYPNVLEAMRERWISPQFISTNRIDRVQDYAEVRDLGLRAIEALGIGTSATHMEWFFGPKGLRFSEIGCRPPGVRAWDLYAAGNDVDIYREWANAIVHHRVEHQLSRRRAAGIVALRPDRDGTISHYEGIEDVQRRFGEWILDTHLPGSGTLTQPVEAGYMANAWIRMAHPDYDTLHSMLDVVGETVRVRAS
jgi:formate-dependent phosphoribosylglycinamide formyltransferase (GAR transformylase)